MSEPAVTLRNVTKVFTTSQEVKIDDIYAVRNMNLEIPAGEFFTLLGPSGCGKTTTLRLIAGFETPTEGEVFIKGTPVSKTPPNKRPVNTVFQNYALFPHLTVSRNVGFGLEIKKVPREEREIQVEEALKLVQLEGMGARKPSQLSGGQQQRVALARALVNKPAVLLLDEPLGALDLKLRKAMQLELKHIQAQVGITFVYVTHDQEEALTMSDRIAVMNKGQILQLGDPVSLYERPANQFVADFIGESNFITGTVEGVEEAKTQIAAEGAIVEAFRGGQSLVKGQEVLFTVRPEKMRVAKATEAIPGGLLGTILDAIYIGTDTRYLVKLVSGRTVIARVQNSCGVELADFGKGEEVRVFWVSEDAHILYE